MESGFGLLKIHLLTCAVQLRLSCPLHKEEIPDFPVAGAAGADAQLYTGGVGIAHTAWAQYRVRQGSEAML